jgi:hypothetical protein
LQNKVNTEKSAWELGGWQFFDESCAIKQGTGKRGVRYFLNPFSDS